MCNKVRPSETRPGPLVCLWVDDSCPLPCCTSLISSENWKNRTLKNLAKCSSKDCINAPSIHTHSVDSLRGCTLSRQCFWPQNERVLLKGLWLVLGESYPDVSTMNQIKHMSDTIPLIFIIFWLLKAKKILRDIMDVLGRFSFYTS